MSRLSISSEQFYEMCLLEIEYILQEKDKEKKLDQARQAYYNSCMIQNEKANEMYKDITNDILGISKTQRLKQDVARYKMISERLNLKFPKVS